MKIEIKASFRGGGFRERVVRGLLAQAVTVYYLGTAEL